MYWYHHWGRPPLLMQKHNLNEDGSAAVVRSASNWHGHITVTSWNVGVFTQAGGPLGPIGLSFRYKEDTNFLVRRTLFWDRDFGCHMDNAVVLRKTPVNPYLWDWFITPPQGLQPRLIYPDSDLIPRDDPEWQRFLSRY